MKILNKLQMTKQKKISTLVIVVLVIVFGGIFGAKGFYNHMVANFMKNYKAPAVAVSAQEATTQSWTPYITSVGTLTADNWVSVSPQINGQVVGIHFISGQMVKQGDLLVKLDDSTYQAQLAGAKAKVKLDQITFDRDRTLLNSGATTQQQVDQDLANLQYDQSQAAYYQAQIVYTNVSAPFTGKIGIRQVNLGQYLSAGTAIANLSSLDPMFVDFPVTQQQLAQVSVGQAVNMTVSAFPGKVFTGKVFALDSQVTSSNLGLTVRAAIPNTDAAHRLLPGMLANIQILLPTQESVVTIPQIAVNQTLYGSTAFLVETTQDKDGKDISVAHLVNISIGDSQNNNVAITAGVKAGDRVVTSGQLKLHEGTLVNVVPWNQLPTPAVGSGS